MEWKAGREGKLASHGLRGRAAFAFCCCSSSFLLDFPNGRMHRCKTPRIGAQRQRVMTSRRASGAEDSSSSPNSQWQPKRGSPIVFISRADCCGVPTDAVSSFTIAVCSAGQWRSHVLFGV